MTNAIATSPTFTLRDYQKRAIAEIYASIRSNNKRICCVAATGSGKTVIASQLIAHAISKGRKVLFLVTISCLINQTISKLEGLKVGVIAGGHPHTPYNDADVFIASLQTLKLRPEWLSKHWDLVIWDEAHTSCWFGVAQDLLNSKSIQWHIGLTATPYRLRKDEAFSDIFQDAVIAPSMGELIEMGSLAPLSYDIANIELNLDGVRKTGGDFNTAAIARIVNKPEMINAVLDERQRRAPGKRTIAFAVDVNHAFAIAQIANKRGIKSAVVVGSTQNREEIFAQLAQGEIELISSCMALSTGFDLPSVEVALLMRPTLSRALHEQQIGRVARPAEGKTHGIVIDAVQNVKRLGHPCRRVHSKQSVLAPTGEASLGEAPIKFCPECREEVLASLMTCPFCGYTFEPPEVPPVTIAFKEQIPLKLGEVRAFDGHAIATGFPPSMAQRLQLLIERCLAKKYKPAWIAYRFTEAYPAVTGKQMEIVAKVIGYKSSWAYAFLQNRGGSHE